MLDKASRVAAKIKAEVWAVSSKAANGQVPDLFTRMAAMAFEKVVQDEGDPPKLMDIGNCLNDSDLPVEKAKSSNCCAAQ